MQRPQCTRAIINALRDRLLRADIMSLVPQNNLLLIGGLAMGGVSGQVAFVLVRGGCRACCLYTWSDQTLRSTFPLALSDSSCQCYCSLASIL
jgi:hypothetical protein